MASFSFAAWANSCTVHTYVDVTDSWGDSRRVYFHATSNISCEHARDVGSTYAREWAAEHI